MEKYLQLQGPAEASQHVPEQQLEPSFPQQRQGSPKEKDPTVVKSAGPQEIQHKTDINRISLFMMTLYLIGARFSGSLAKMFFLIFFK